MCATPACAGVFKRAAVVMGTDFEATLVAPDEAAAQRAFDAAFREMERIEAEMSEWREGSYVSEINKSAGVSAVRVPEELFNVIDASQKVSELTDGAFDATWASMRGLWDFRQGQERVPAPEEIRARLPLVNYRDIVLDRSKKTVFLRRKGMAIGLGAIAKGYAVDRAMMMVAVAGVKDAIVKAGGDMRVQGTNNGAPWDIGIKHPRDKFRLLARLKLTNISISTSGDYERFFLRDGKLYHHIMDPHTGYPADKAMSVTILAPDTMTSDALSTAVFVLGPKAGMELVKKLNGVEALIVDASGETHASTGIKLR